MTARALQHADRRRTTRRRLLAAAAGAALTGTTLGACGGSGLDPTASVPGRVVFAISRDGHADIYQLHGETTQRMATDGSADAAAPAWSPNGQYIAYITDKNQLSIIKTDPHVPGVLITPETTDVSAAPRSPAWLPNGTLSYRAGDKLIIVQPDGKRVRELSPRHPSSTTGTLGSAYAWSPDGHRLVFDCGGDHGTSVCETDLGNGETKVLVEPKVKLTTMAWSPDGDTIVAGGAALPGGEAEVYVFPADGKDLHPLPQPGHDTSPAWSPDGRSIVYASDRNDEQGLWVMQSDGSAAKPLLSENGVSSPAWSK